MNPTAPSQPPLNTVYAHPSNPATSTFEANDNSTTAASLRRSDPISESRKVGDVPDGQGNVGENEGGMPSSLGYGVRDSRRDRGEAMGAPVSNTEGEQMRAAGEGDIAAAQDTKHGFGEQSDLASGLDRKKEEQAGIKEARSGGMAGEGRGVDVKGVLGGRKSGFVGTRDDTGSGGGGIQSGHGQV